MWLLRIPRIKPVGSRVVCGSPRSIARFQASDRAYMTRKAHDQEREDKSHTKNSDQHADCQEDIAPCVRTFLFRYFAFTPALSNEEHDLKDNQDNGRNQA